MAALNKNYELFKNSPLFTEFPFTFITKLKFFRVTKNEIFFKISLLFTEFPFTFINKLTFFRVTQNEIFFQRLAIIY